MSPSQDPQVANCEEYDSDAGTVNPYSRIEARVQVRRDASSTSNAGYASRDYGRNERQTTAAVPPPVPEAPPVSSIPPPAPEPPSVSSPPAIAKSARSRVSSGLTDHAEEEGRTGHGRRRTHHTPTRTVSESSSEVVHCSRFENLSEPPNRSSPYVDARAATARPEHRSRSSTRDPRTHDVPGHVAGSDRAPQPFPRQVDLNETSYSSAPPWTAAAFAGQSAPLTDGHYVDTRYTSPYVSGSHVAYRPPNVPINSHIQPLQPPMLPHPAYARPWPHAIAGAFERQYWTNSRAQVASDPGYRRPKSTTQRTPSHLSAASYQYSPSYLPAHTRSIAFSDPVEGQASRRRQMYSGAPYKAPLGKQRRHRWYEGSSPVASMSTNEATPTSQEEIMVRNHRGRRDRGDDDYDETEDQRGGARHPWYEQQLIVKPSQSTDDAQLAASIEMQQKDAEAYQSRMQAEATAPMHGFHTAPSRRTRRIKASSDTERRKTKVKGSKHVSTVTRYRIDKDSEGLHGTASDDIVVDSEDHMKQLVPADTRAGDSETRKGRQSIKQYRYTNRRHERDTGHVLRASERSISMNPTAPPQRGGSLSSRSLSMLFHATNFLQKRARFVRRKNIMTKRSDGQYRNLKCSTISNSGEGDLRNMAAMAPSGLRLARHQLPRIVDTTKYATVAEDAKKARYEDGQLSYHHNLNQKYYRGSNVKTMITYLKKHTEQGSDMVGKRGDDITDEVNDFYVSTTIMARCGHTNVSIHVAFDNQEGRAKPK